MKKSARESNFKTLVFDLIEAGFEIPGKETLRRLKVNKVKKSEKSSIYS